MFLYLFAIALLISIIYFYIRWTKVRRYWKEKGVPYITPHPILGTLTFLQKQNPTHWMREVYKDFKSPYVGVWLFWRPALLINSPEICKKILVTESDKFRNKFATAGKTDPLKSNIMTLSDPTWSPLRRRLSTMFTSAKLRYSSQIVKTKCNDLIERIKRQPARNDLNLRTVCSDYTTDVIGESAFGVISETSKLGDSVMRTVTRQFMAFDLHRGLSWCSIFFFPELVDLFRFSVFPHEAVQRLRIILRSVIEQRGGHNRKVEEPRDLLDALLKIKQEAAEEGEDLGEEFILAQASVFLLGGFDTTGSGLSWMIYELAWHPECQQQLYKDIVKVKEIHGDLDQNALSEITYLNCIIKETLRLFPPMGWLDRVAAKDFQVDDNLTIPAGTPVLLNAAGIHMDPQYYMAPTEYNPTRFLPENEKDLTPFTFLPFGDGPRMCVETLRLFPPMGWLDRVAAKDFQVDDNLTIPAGTPVLLNAAGIHMDPQYYMAPTEYNPTRFLPENEKDLTPFTFLPFGDGPRMCVGMRFAYQVLRQAISSIVLNFDVQKVPDTPSPQDVQVEKHGLFFLPLDDKMVVRFVPREKISHCTQELR